MSLTRLGLCLCSAFVVSLVVPACSDPGDDEVATTTTSDTIDTTDSSDSSTATDTTTDDTTTTTTTTTTSSSDTTTSTTSSTSSGTETITDTETATDSMVACEGEYQCVPAAPEGWQGPAARVDNHLDAELSPVCGGLFPITVGSEVNDSPQGDPAECSACGCGFANGFECRDVEVSFYSSSTCSSAVSTQSFPSGACTAADDAGDSASYASVGAVGVKPGTGTCLASGGLPAKSNPTWGLRQRQCKSLPTNRVCTVPTESCVPKTAEPQLAGVCIWKEGEETCPAEVFTERSVRYTGFDDQRTCTSCTCGDPAGENVACEVNAVMRSATDCVGGSSDLLTEGADCTRLFNLAGKIPESVNIEVVKVTGEAACPASGGAATGQVLPAKPVTFCCTAG